ncbi:MAG TPA: SRPBCC family protein [Solirubrobacteraceae bacterium]|jgi:uncharacterized protein YndB with AHSA1/START domain|nr:SRPBCC family protein [Solirubrobacteraceae bacterium]
MPTVRRTRTIDASPEELWDVLGDPHHLPRWWPRVSRVEAVDEDAFTEVLMGPSGKIVRADFKLLEQVDRQRIVWAQQVENTPFARVLRSAETEISLVEGRGEQHPVTEVAIELRQELQGFRGESTLSLRMSGISRFGSPLVRKAAASTIDEALDGLERIAGRATT